MTSFSPVDSWVLAKLLAGQSINGELAQMSDGLRPLGTLLGTMQPSERVFAWQGAKVLRSDRERLQKAVLDADPDAPPPVEQPQIFATAADVRRTMAQDAGNVKGGFPKPALWGSQPERV